MKLLNVKWIFFDIGHTLLDEDAAHLLRLEELEREVHERGSSCPPIEVMLSEMTEFGTQGAQSPFYAVAGKYGVKRIIPYDPAGEAPFPEAKQVLALLSTRFKLGIIANQRGGSAHRLQQHGLMKYIDFVYSSEELGRSKPSPELFLSALENLDCAAEDACMVGDRIDNDIRPAKRLGMRTVRVRQGFYRNRVPECEYDIPDADIGSLGELPAVFGL